MGTNFLDVFARFERPRELFFARSEKSVHIDPFEEDRIDIVVGACSGADNNDWPFQALRILLHLA